ncbi:MAG: hypothetical protein WC538_19365 [Thermoanaerobaculia bacterium]|jgi:hypothetical protein
MDRRVLLLSRLDAIGAALSRRDGALALLGLGSVGIETDRIDEFSDLDFFAIVAPGHKTAFLGDLGWLSDAAPLVYAFRNTVDGFKILFDDGIYGEFAVFERGELAAIPFAEGRIVWRAAGVDDAMRIPVRAPARRGTPDRDWCVGEALTCLFVGVGRFRRGEKLSAERLVQHHAVDRIIELAELIEPGRAGSADPYSAERRFEARFPSVAENLGRFVQGYDWTPESARAILEFLEAHFEVNAPMRAEVMKSIDAAIRQRDGG